MYNDSIEMLLSRHYGENSPAPKGLEQRLVTSTRQEVAEMQRAEALATRICQQRISRRRLVQLVALGSAGLGALSTGLSLGTHDPSQPAYIS